MRLDERLGESHSCQNIPALGASGGIYLAGDLTNKCVPYRRSERMFEACIGSVVLYIGEARAITENYKYTLTCCHRRMEDCIRLEIESCGNCSMSCWKKILRWLGHVLEERKLNDLVIYKIF